MDTDKKCFNCKIPLQNVRQSFQEKQAAQMQETAARPAEEDFVAVRPKPIYTYWWFLLTALAVILAITFAVLYIVAKNTQPDVVIPDFGTPASVVSEDSNRAENSVSPPAEQSTAGDGNVIITLPEFFLEIFGDFNTGLNIDGSNDASAISGISYGDDGTFSVTVTKEKHRGLLDAIRRAIETNLQKIMNDEITKDQFVSIVVESDCSTITVTIPQRRINNLQQDALWGLHTQCLFYQMFDGKPDGSVRQVLVYEENGEILSLHDYTLDEIKEPPQPLQIPYTFGEPFEYGGFSIMLSDNVQWTTISRTTSEYFGEEIFAVPISVKNTTQQVRKFDVDSYRQYSPAGYMLNHPDADLDYSFDSMKALAPEEEAVTYMYFFNDGNGQYRIEFGNVDPESSIEVILAIEKPEAEE